MADKQLSLKQSADDSLFADDDPLAALARIASFDPQGETRPKPSVSRREPEFDLEDELLKEFEQYEEPALPAAAPEIHADRTAAADAPNLFASEPTFHEPAFDDDGAFDSQTVFGDEAPAAAPILTVEPEAPAQPPVPELRAVAQPSFVGPSEPIRPVAHPVFDLEDEILKEFAAFDARRSPQKIAPQIQIPAVEPEAKPVAAPVFVEPTRVEPAFAEASTEDHDQHSGYGDDVAAEPVAAVERVAAAKPAADLPALDAMEAEIDPGRWLETKEPIFAGEEEPEASSAAEEIAEEPALFEVESVARERWDDEIATDAAAHFDIPAEPEPMLDIDAEPDAFDDHDDIAADAGPAIPPTVAVVQSPVLASPVVEPRTERVEIARQPVRQDELDELLADVERFPVNPVPPQRAVAPAVPTPVEPSPLAQAPAVTRETAKPAVVFTPSRSFVPAVEPKPVIRDERRAVTPVAEAKPAPVLEQPPVVAPLAEIARRSAVLPLSKTAESTAKPMAAAEPIVQPEAKAVEAVVQPLAKAAEPVAKAPEPAAKPVEHVARTNTASHIDDEGHEVFDETAFELDLTEIELDMLEMEVESSVAPALHEDHVTASEAALADIAEATVAARQPVSAGRRFEPQQKPVEDYSSLPFDPSQISSEEDPVQAIAEMDVPETPVVDHEEATVPAEPDYDIDIDAEMAHIFSRPTGATPAKAGQPAQAASLTPADLDEFERALEEDFRRSLSENRAASTPDRVALTPASYESGRRQGSTGRRVLVLAASVAGLVLIGGAGVYAYWGNSSRLLTTSGEPKIILADKDPVKVEPKDRGGQIVPNQDKAVYDRVSGDNKELTKQDRLVTSNEEPVDVVQKTLMPENLPLDDDQPTATDTSDTTDPRLLPDQQDKNVSTAEATDSVSPRKVRTMVVRSDGTLVPREEEPVVAKEKTPAEQSQERSLSVTPAATADVPERLTANDDIAKQINQANADKSFVPKAKQPADATDTSAQSTDAQNTDAKTPVTTDQATSTQNDTATTTDQATTTDPAAAATDQQPVTADASSDAKPDTTPVKTQDLAAATTTSDTADVKPADTSKAADTAADTTSDQPAATATDNTTQSDDAALTAKVKTATLRGNTPIPANRPVDQPVDIVGRVTDQGNVQKSQEVASAEPTDQSVQTTATPPGAYVIQIASLPSEAEAQKSYTKLSARFASVLGGHDVDIRKAAIKNKGTYYRVRIVAGTRQEAADLCSRYKAAGGVCLVSK